MVKKMIIRKCTQADIGAAGAFYDKVVEYLDAHINYPKWMYKVYPSEEFVRDMTREGSQYLCMEKDSVAAAFVLNTDPQGNYGKGHWTRDLPEGSYMILHTLAVDPALSGKGIATRVIDYCIAKGKEEGYKALRLDIVPGNLPAEKLYLKNGFSFAGEADLERGIDRIPFFRLYEKNW